jgi:hypothetical protein
MKKGFLSQYLKQIASKRLTPAEAGTSTSHQHEFNGTAELKIIFGEHDGKTRFNAKFIYLTDQDGDPVFDEGYLTWYDVREKGRKKRGIMRWEYRMYFPDNSPMQCANAGDYLVIAKLADDTILAIIIEKDTTMENQIKWLFGISDETHPGFSIRAELESEQDRITFAAKYILGQIGIELEDEEPDYLEEMLKRFGDNFPTTKVFSEYAQSTLPDISPIDQPDDTLYLWMEREDILYRTFETHFLQNRIKLLSEQSNVNDCQNNIVKFIQSKLQSRRSRVGLAMENHLETIFKKNLITHTRHGTTEEKYTPDFIFPSIDKYHNNNFPEHRLTMLASKHYCKDRWRQILSEAKRISAKHLITFEPKISENQINQMKSELVQLVIPKALHSTYQPFQQKWLMSLKEFISLVQTRQIR